MNINAGLFLDGYATDKPHGAWEYAKNIILADGFKSSRNEKGFDVLASGDDLIDVLDNLANRSYETAKVVGHEYIKTYVLLFVSAEHAGGVSAIILKYDTISDEYELIWEDYTYFYFDPDYVMDCFHTFTPDGDLIIAFCNGTDANCIEPLLMNVDKRNKYYLNNNVTKYPNLLYLFNRTEHLIEQYSIIDDGALEAGVYYCTVRFKYLDGTYTNWCMLTQPIKLGSNPDKPANSSINIRGEYVGSFAYDYIEVAYIHKKEGQVYAYKYGEFPISNTYDVSTGYTYKFDINITSNKGTLVDLDSILVRKAFYRKSNSIEFIRNKVHLAGIKEENIFLNYEKFASDIKVGYEFSYYTKSDGQNNTLAPGDVYALYIYFILKGSGIIALPFNIPGREDYFEEGGDFQDIIAVASDGGTGSEFTCNAHGYANGQYVEITGTTSYDGVYQLTGVATNTFTISTLTFVANETGTVRRVDFKQFETFEDTWNRIVTGGGFTVDTVLDYSDFPSGKTVKVEYVTYESGSEYTHEVSSGLTIDSNLCSNLRSEFNALATAESLTVSASANTSSTITFSSVYEENNGSHFIYTILDGAVDITNLYNDIISINSNYDHIILGSRDEDNSFYYTGYWQNNPNDGSGKHHRMPPIKTLANAFHSASLPSGWAAADFGVDKAVLIDLVFKNIVIPQDIVDRCSYFGFAYAKRKSENKMFYGDSMLFNYHTIPTATGILQNILFPTPSAHLFKHRFNADADYSSFIESSDLNQNFAYLDNFDILNNNLRVNITDIVPEYTMTHEKLKFITLRGATDSDIEYQNGTVLDSYYEDELVHRSSGVSLASYSDVLKVSYNFIVNNNSIFDPGISFSIDTKKDYMASLGGFLGALAGTLPESFELTPRIDNTAGQKHILAALDSAYTFPITVTPYTAISVPSGTGLWVFGNAVKFSDSNGESYSFVIDTALTTEPNTGVLQRTNDVEHAIASIFSIKDSVYIDVKSQELIPLGDPVEITDNGFYNVTIQNSGDCTISEKVTLFTGDAFLPIGSLLDNVSGTNVNEVSYSEGRNRLENHANSGSNFIVANKMPFRHLTYGISDLEKIYREDSNDPQSNLALDYNKAEQCFGHNPYKEPTCKYNNDYNSLQDLDTPLFITRELPEYNLNKIVRGTNYKNEDIDISALKTFLVDDYYMMPGNAKDIIKINKMGDDLIIQQRYGLYFAFIKDYLSLQGANAYLGTGELFDRMPRHIRYGNNDPVNCSHKLSTLMTTFGYVVFDDITKKLSLFNGEKLNVLSNQNAQNYFRENYSFDGLEYNPIKDNSNGVILGFDGLNKAIHISKIINGGTDINLSFSFLINNFLSFHEWVPTYIFGSEDKVFSFDSSGVLHKHNSNSSVCLFYNRVTPAYSILDVLFTGGDQYKNISKVLQSVLWESQAIDIVTNVNDYNKTVDDIMIYTDDQCSGYITIESGNWFDKVGRDIIKTWQLNKFRDLVLDNSAVFLTNYEPNANVSSNKNWFDKSLFKSKYFAVRFRMLNDNSGNQYKIILNNLSVNANIAKR